MKTICLVQINIFQNQNTVQHCSTTATLSHNDIDCQQINIKQKNLSFCTSFVFCH